MKTNHNRGFVARSPSELRVGFDYGTSSRSEFCDRAFYAKWMGYGCDRQNRRHKAGGKKFVRSRFRFHEKQVVRALMKEV